MVKNKHIAYKNKHSKFQQILRTERLLIGIFQSALSGVPNTWWVF